MCEFPAGKFQPTPHALGCPPQCRRRPRTGCQCRFAFRVACPPGAQRLPLILRTSACSAGSSRSTYTNSAAPR